MSSGNEGLRFDVYERVHLPDDVAAIDELEEIELVPRIQVLDQGEQAVLKGQLLLSGVYRSQSSGGGPLTLEHWIPVEISLPMNRVSRLDDISIEIDNFDVDLISARTLNITGVLSLRGISVEALEEEQQWQDEPITAVHQRESIDIEPDAEGAYAAREESSYINADAAEEQEAPYLLSNAHETEPFYAQGNVYEPEEREDEIQTQASPQPFAEEAIDPRRQEEGGWLQWSALAEAGNRNAEAERTLAEQDDATPSYAGSRQQDTEGETLSEPLYGNGGRQEESHPAWTEFALQAEQATYSNEGKTSDSGLTLNEAEDTIREPEALQQAEADLNEATEDIVQEAAAPPARQEVQIAFSGKPSSASEQGRESLGFRTLLQSSKRDQAAKEAAQQLSDERDKEESERTAVPEDEIQWKQLFLAKQAEGNEFRKIRMCIVQREETLEQIASRYSINPRDLLVHNRMHESAVEEGQLLYIP